MANRISTLRAGRRLLLAVMRALRYHARPVAPSRQGTDDSDWHDLRDQLRATFVVGVTLVLSIMVSLWSEGESELAKRGAERRPVVDGVVGWPKQVNPLGSLPAVHGLSRRGLITEMEFEGVGPEGVMDMTRGPNRGRYVMVEPKRTPKAGSKRPSPPIPVEDLCNRRTVRLGGKGLTIDAGRKVACGPTPPEALPDPKCGPTELWRMAVVRGASEKLPASFRYYWSVSGAAWRMTIAKTSFALTTDVTCTVELTAENARPKS
jgi:hypothetical protein